MKTLYKLFNQSLYLTKSKEIFDTKPQHDLLMQAANTISQRLSWTKKTYSNVLILGPYAYCLYDSFKNLHQNYFLNNNICIQFKDLIFKSEKIPFQKNSFDAIFSFFDIQSINDVPGYLKQICHILLPNGFFQAVFLGNDSLLSLKTYLMQKEILFEKGASLRFHPTISLDDAAILLNRAGFDCPIVDHDRFILKDTFYNLISNLRALHATQILTQRPPILSKALSQFLIHDKEILNTSIDFIYMTALGPINKNQLINNNTKKQITF